MAAKVTATAVGERMTVEEFTRQFITRARDVSKFAGINTAITKHQGHNFNEWYRSYYSRGLLVEDAPESPVDATQALAASGKLRIGRGARTKYGMVGVSLILPEDTVNNGDRKAASPLDALTI